MVDISGFISFVSGLVFGVTIQFDSPVNAGGDVEMICEYSDPGSKGIVVTWYRQTEPEISAITSIWIYSSSGTRNAAVKEFEKKIDLISQRSYLVSHGIKLLRAEKSDEGEYWCVVRIKTQRTRSLKRQLNVTGEEFSHA